MAFSLPKYISLTLLLPWTIPFVAATVHGQSPADSICHVVLPAPQATVPYSGAVTRLNVQAGQSNCASKPESRVDWVSVSVVPPSSSAARALQYAVQPNLTFRPRTASISVGDQDLTISQEAGPKPGIAGPSTLEWVVQESGTKVEKKIVHIGSDDPDLDLTAMPHDPGLRWLSVQKRDERTFEVSVDAGGLGTGTHKSYIVIHAAGAKNDPLTIPVSVKVLP